MERGDDLDGDSDDEFDPDAAGPSVPPPRKRARAERAGVPDARSKRCEEPGCGKQSTFGFVWGNQRRCKKHVLTGMFDVRSKRCEEPGCNKRPSFGFVIGKPTRCKKHASADMTDVVNKRCEEPGCGKQSSFGFDIGKPTRCKKHALTDMIDVVNKRCEEPGCSKRTSFGFDRRKPKRCKEHALAGMFDVVNRRCEEPGCCKRPSYGFVRGDRKRCKEHALAGMFDVNNKMCEEPCCGKRPTFGYRRGEATRCRDHALENMIDAKHALCPGPPDGGGCFEQTRIHRPYEFCPKCDPDTARAQARCRVERRFLDRLDAWILVDAERRGVPETDRKLLLANRQHAIVFGCEKRSQKQTQSCRLDGTVFRDGVLYIIEVDEEYHRAYAFACDVARMISTTLAIRLDGWDGPIAWIRANPHKLRDAAKGGIDHAGSTDAFADAVCDEAIAILAAGGAAGLECVNFPEQRESRMRAGMDDPSAVFDDDYDSEDDDDDDAPA